MPTDRDIEAIRNRVDMLALVGERVKLRPRGANHVGTCPFCDRVDAFNVSAEHRFFHCFGCKASGDAFEFVKRTRGVSFPRAVAILAERAGVEVPPP